jgi:hypothetical protein
MSEFTGHIPHEIRNLNKILNDWKIIRQLFRNNPNQHLKHCLILKPNNSSRSDITRGRFLDPVQNNRKEYSD